MKMNCRKLIGRLLLLAGATTIFGCAKSVSDTSNYQIKEYLDSWVSKTYPEAKMIGNGVYLLSEEVGTGEEYQFQNFISIKNTVRYTNGTITSSTEADIAKQLGTYKESNYYGPKIWLVNEQRVPVGVYDMLTGMKKGGSRKVLIPSWLMGTTRYKSSEEYMKHTDSNVSNQIYELTLEDFFDNVIDYQVDSIKSYMKHHIQADSLDKGFYFKELSGKASTPKFESDTTFYINYTGRLLNGQVFSTTVADTARKYNIYSSATKYEPVKIDWKSDYTKIGYSGQDNSSFITGFQLLIYNLKKDSKAFAIFTSDYGYKENATGNSIPAYSPLHYEVEYVEKAE